MDKAVHQIKAGKACEKKAAPFPTGSSICLFLQGSTLPFCAFPL